MTHRARTICVLGGTGFVGRHLCARLVSDGHSLRVLTRYREQHRHLLVLPTVQIIQGDVHDEVFLESALEGCDAMINLVGILNEKGRDGRGFEKAHVELTRKAVRACRNNGVRRFLQMSALKADAENGPSHYLRTKGQAEALVRLEDGNDLHTTIFQPSVIFGAEDSFINRFAAMVSLPNYFFVLPTPNARFAPVYVDDVAEAFARALNDSNTWGKTYQLCGPKVMSLREVIRFVATTLGLRRKIIGLGESISRLLARVMEWAPGKPLSMDNYRSLQVHNICDSNGFAALGIEPASMSAVVPRYLAKTYERARLSEIREQAPSRD